MTNRADIQPAVQAPPVWQSRLPIDSATIARNRQIVLSNTSPQLFEQLISAWATYDRLVFDSWISTECNNRCIEMSLSGAGRSKKIGARLITKTRKQRPVSMHIRLSPAYISEKPRPIRIFGQSCMSDQEIAISLLEHEMVHQVEFLIYGNSNCRKPLFAYLAKSFFGHGTTDGLSGCGKSVQ